MPNGSDRTHPGGKLVGVVESISKTPVAHAEAAAIIQDAYGPGVALAEFTECTEGWFNAVYQLALSDGTTCILKVAPPPEIRVLTYEHDIITTEVEALRLIRERTTVPVPEVLWWDASCRRLPSPLFLMQQCPGRLLSTVRSTLDDEQQATIDAQLVGYLAQMNGITDRTFGRPDRAAPRHATWSAAFGQLVSDLLADGQAANVELPVAPQRIAALVDEHADALDAVTTPSFLHWDLWDPNVFVDADTSAVVGLIDFERVLWGDPLMEAQFTGKRDDDELMNTYGSRLFELPDAVPRRRLYDLYLYLVMIVECAYRNYPTDDIEQIGRAGLAAVLTELGI